MLSSLRGVSGPNFWVFISPPEKGGSFLNHSRVILVVGFGGGAGPGLCDQDMAKPPPQMLTLPTHTESGGEGAPRADPCCTAHGARGPERLWGRSCIWQDGSSCGFPAPSLECLQARRGLPAALPSEMCSLCVLVPTLTPACASARTRGISAGPRLKQHVLSPC